MNCLCFRCGQSFSCGMLRGQHNCWCATVDPVEVLRDSPRSCLCPSCIGKNKTGFSLREVNWRLIVGYHGMGYHGFQSQQEQPTVQRVLADSFYKLTNQIVPLRVAGRTDAGVHARGQVISCLLKSRFDGRSLVLAMSNVLPKDVTVWRADETPKAFDAKLHSVGKRYVYRIDQSLAHDPFSGPQKWHLRSPLDIESMETASKYLLGAQDFESFRSKRCEAPHARRYLWHLSVQKKDQLVEFDIRGNAFCHHMVRIVVGTLVEVGRGKKSPFEVGEILNARDRTLAGQTAPACGLTLEEVYYPDDLDSAGISRNASFPRFPVSQASWPFRNCEIKRGRTIT